DHAVVPVPVAEKAGQRLLPGADLVADRAAQAAVVQRAPVGAVGAAGVLGLVLFAGAGRDRGVHPGQPDDLAGKVVPGADALAGAVVQAVLMGDAQLQNLVGQVHRVGGVAQLVVDHLQPAVLFARAGDGLDKVFAVVAVQPGGADDEVPVAEPLDVLLPHQLGGAVGADGPGQAGLVLGHAAVLPPRKDVVGGDMHQPRAHLLGGLGQVAGAQGVGLVGGVVVCLAAVHVGVGGAVDDDVGLVAADEVIHRLVVGDVQLGQVHRDDGGVEQLFGDGADLALALPQLLDDLGAQLPPAACDDDFHSSPLRLRVRSAAGRLSSAACRRRRFSGAARRATCRTARRTPAA